MNVPVVTGPAFASAMFLAYGGVSKWFSPRASTEALARIGLATQPQLVFGLAAGEVAIGAVTMIVGGRAFYLTAIMYLVFAAVGAIFVRVPDLSSCGCLGDVAMPPTLAHIAGCVATFGLAALAGWQRAPGVLDLWEKGLVYPLAVVAGAASLVVTITGALVMRSAVSKSIAKETT
jgi:hypothetical protein